MTELPKDYVFVANRIEQFHKRHPDGCIKTHFVKKWDFTYFIAKITPDINEPNRYFTGSSSGDLLSDKAFEKLETVAIGRALAFAGFETKGAYNKAQEESTLAHTIWKQPATEKQIEILLKKCEKVGLNENVWLLYLNSTFGVNDAKELNKLQASKIIIELNDPKKIKEIKALWNSTSGIN